MRPVPLVVLTAVAALLLAATGADGEEAGRRLRMNQEGVLETGDALNDSNCFEDLYTVELDKGAAMFRLHSDDFDAVLKVVAPDGTIYDNDDFGNGKDSGINLAVKIPGSYKVHVSCANEGEHGAYRLTVQGLRPPEDKAPEPSNLDRVQLASGQDLAGAISFGKTILATPFGDLPLPAAKLAGLRREASGLTTVLLKDGSRVQGWLDGEPARLRLAGGSELLLPLRELASLTPAAGPPLAGEPPTLWVSLGGSRLAARWNTPQVQMMVSFGTVAVAADQVSAINPPSPDHPLGQVTLRDGSRLTGLPASLPMSLAEFPLPPPAGATVEGGKAQRAGGAFVLTLASGDEVVGILQAFALRSPYGEVAIAAGQVLSLTADAEHPDLLTVVLASGERAFGRCTTPTLTIATAWNPTLALPQELVLAGAVGKN